MAIPILLFLTVVLYGVGCWYSFRFYRDQDLQSDRTAARWLMAGLALQGTLLLLKGWMEGVAPLVSLDGILSALSFSLTAALLVGRLKTPVGVLLSLFSPFLFLMALFAFITGLPPMPLMDKALMTDRLASHIFLTFLGFSHFTLGFGVGVAFWVQDGQLKQHRPGALTLPLPALEALDRLTVFYIGLGFLFWLAGLSLGTWEAYEVWDRLPWSDPKILGSFLVLGIYGLFFILRWSLRMRGRRSMVLVMAGYLLALFTFVGVKVLLNAPHGF
ncbi:MAG TPA: cytochrome c biogenesis protein CcsA [bacterium]|nr:cytochrome c biogenesis protein CcsA [bacterium]